MPRIRPISAIGYPVPASRDISDRIAPPYDVLDADSKAALLAKSEHNIVAVDLPHLPAKTLGPDSAYEQAGATFADWLAKGVVERRVTPALFAYQQTYTVGETTFKRRGLIANVAVQAFGPAPKYAPAGSGGIFPHEQTFSAAKADRLKLMQATGTQLSPIFGIHSDPEGDVHKLISEVINAGPASFFGTTADGVLHEAWVVDDDAAIARFQTTLAPADTFIADGHHRYNTALNYRNALADAGKLDPADDSHPANSCLFVLVAMQDPGMIVLPTHRVLGGMADFSWERFTAAAEGLLTFTDVAGDDLEALEAQLPAAGPHAIGLYVPSKPGGPLAIATTVNSDPLATLANGKFAGQSEAWRQLDVAIAQHLIVEAVCEPTFCNKVGEGESATGGVTWKFPHDLDELRTMTDSDAYDLGLVMQATPLESVRQVSEAGELMPQKSTFFYPKLATGMVINPIV